MLWKAHIKIGDKELQYYYRPFSLDTYIKKEIFYDNAYKVLKDVYENSRVLDVGSHIGLFALLASRFTDKIITFEPDERNRQIMLLNIAKNGLSEDILSLPFAINGTQSPTTIMHFYNNTGNNTCIPYPFNCSKQVKVVNADINIYLPCDILKLDIEGSEYDVIDSIKDLSQIGKALTIEIHYHIPEWKSRLHNMIKKLTESRFKVEWVKKYSYNGHIYAERTN
jgi:FkbM family methyltransferase